VGTTADYRKYEDRARRYLQELGRDPASLDRVAATINYRENRVLLFGLPDPSEELSVVDTLAHELLHAILDQLGEGWAARRLDEVVRPVGRADRVGGV
jgi:hypothetical protein